MVEQRKKEFMESKGIQVSELSFDDFLRIDRETSLSPFKEILLESVTKVFEKVVDKLNEEPDFEDLKKSNGFLLHNKYLDKMKTNLISRLKNDPYFAKARKK